ncbi:cytosolic sulfotransferase 12 [Arachis hypogaea]|uniref:cytosolic sulfotransferase 12 n=1 Tax=Arachis hypogaea TaxID=3818 RepID=UPI003B21D766
MEEVISGEPSNLPKLLKDEDLRQECKDLMSTLPMEPTYKLYQYQGFWYGSWALQGILSCQKHFEANDKDIILVTTPKSGTTWLKALTFALLNRNKHPHTQKNHPLLVTNPHILVPFLESLFYDEKYIVSNLSQFPSPRLLSIHAPYVSLPKSAKESNCKIVYLCRDPKDISVSMWKFMETLMPEIRGSNLFDEFFELFCRGVNLYGPFWEHVLEYWKESLKRPEKIMFLRAAIMSSSSLHGIVPDSTANFQASLFSAISSS